MTIDLYPHNQRAYELVKREWESNNRACVVQPTGTGKSFVILKLLSDYNDMPKLVLAPTRYILNQFREQLCAYEIENTTLLTYAKLSKMNNNEIQNLSPHIIVCDEMHRVLASVWNTGVERLLSCNENSKLLGTTATPVRYMENRNVAEEMFKGHVVVDMSLVDAIAEEILPLPRYISSLYTYDEELKKLRGQIDASTNTEAEKNQLYLQVDELKKKLEKSHGMSTIFKKYITSFNGKFIVFAQNKAHLKSMQGTVENWFKEAGAKDIHTYAVYDGYSHSKKDFNNFKETKGTGLHLLFCVNILNEGIHVNVDGVLLLRPTVSGNVYYQQIGRAIDCGSKNKTPLIFDAVNNYNSVMANTFITDLKEAFNRANTESKKALGKVNISDFIILDELQDTLNMFTDIENRLEDSWDLQFQKLCEFKEQYGHCKVNKEYDETVYRWAITQKIFNNKGQLREDRKEKLNDIRFCWDVRDEKFEIGYEHALKYYDSHDNINVSKGYIDEDGYRTGKWICTQRQRYKSGKISNTRAKKLEKLGISWNPFDDAFQNALNHVKEYHVEHRDLNVPRSYKSPDGYNLGDFITTQRQKYKKHKLTQEKTDILNQYGMIWNRDVYDCEILIKHYTDYKKKYGEPTRSIVTDDGYNLGMACNAIRCSYRRGTLPQWKIDMLNKAGFSWESPRKSGRNGKSTQSKHHIRTNNKQKAEYQLPAL